FNPDGNRLATASSEGGAQVWDVQSGTIVLELREPSDSSGTGARPVEHFSTITISSDGNKIATGTSSGTAHVWDAHSGTRLLQLKGHRKHINSVFFSPDGTHLATVSADGVGLIWDAQSGEILYELSDHTATVHDIVFSPDGSRLATKSSDGTV